MNTTLIETTSNGEYPIDIFTKLSNDRILFINDEINDHIASEISATLLYKDMENNEDTITLFLNTTGGDIRAIMMIYDTMQILTSPVKTICCGSAMNETVLLLAAGTKGLRFATKNAIIAPSQLNHDQSYMTSLTDAKVVMEQSVKDNKSFMKSLAKSTQHKLSELIKDFDRKQFLTAKEALNYGFIDEVI